ncbi:hypothetical protein [Moritella dasanensis]|uniref:hypothetical protein n=1 Tax=Moritella dasanensis TaxID=428031 RepID=UPI00030FE441|nr:hypothetical protein [Moritella dasanensis]
MNTVYCLLIAECITGYRKHVKNGNAYDVGGQSEILKRFNNQVAFNNLNTEMGIFTKLGNYSVGNYNKPYLLNQFWLRRLDAVLTINQTHKLSESNKWHEFVYSNPITTSTIDPDIEALSKLYYIYLDDTPQHIEKRNIIWALINCYKHHGCIIQYYDVSGGIFGRYWTKGALGLQQQDRSIRNATLNQYTEYDMKAAAYAILLSLVRNKSKYPTISNYVADTEQARLRIALNSGTSSEKVKLVFLHQSFGSSLGCRSAIHDEVGGEALAAIKNEQEFELFRAEFKDMTKELQRIKASTHEQVKAYRKSIHEKTYTASFIAKLYQDIECKITCLIRDQLANKKDCLLLHDGVFTKEKLDCNQLSLLIKQELNIDIKIGKK